MAPRWTATPSLVMDGRPRIGRHVPLAIARSLGPRAVGAQRLVVGIDDHFAAGSVDDHRGSRTDFGGDALGSRDVWQPESPSDDGGVRGFTTAFADHRHDAGTAECEQVQRAHVDTHGDGSARGVRLGRQLRQSDQHAENPVRRGVEIGHTRAKVGIIESREGRPDPFQRERHRPLGREALVLDEAIGFTRELGTAQDAPVELDEIQRGATLTPELPPQSSQLLLGAVEGGGQTGELAVSLLLRDPSLQDRHPNLGHVRGPDPDPAGGAQPATAHHLDIMYDLAAATRRLSVRRGALGRPERRTNASERLASHPSPV